MVPAAGVKMLPHHPTSIDYTECFDVRKALNVISGATFMVRWNTIGSGLIILTPKA